MLLMWRLQGLAGPARWLGGVLLLQLLTGVSNIALDWPLAGAVLHRGGAALLVALLVVVNFRLVRASR